MSGVVAQRAVPQAEVAAAETATIKLFHQQQPVVSMWNGPQRSSFLLLFLYLPVSCFLLWCCCHSSSGSGGSSSSRHGQVGCAAAASAAASWSSTYLTARGATFMKGRRSRYSLVASTGRRTTSLSPGITLCAHCSATLSLPAQMAFAFCERQA